MCACVNTWLLSRRGMDGDHSKLRKGKKTQITITLILKSDGFLLPLWCFCCIFIVLGLSWSSVLRWLCSLLWCLQKQLCLWKKKLFLALMSIRRCPDLQSALMGTFESQGPAAVNRCKRRICSLASLLTDNLSERTLGFHHHLLYFQHRLVEY